MIRTDNLQSIQFSPANELVEKLGKQAKAAAAKLAQVPITKINQTLLALAHALREQTPMVLEANARDMAAVRVNSRNAAILDRLLLNKSRINAIASGIEQVAALPDPVGQILWQNTRPNGLRIERVSCPFGVLGMIYESRPNVTIDAAVLCLKSRNSVILRGGSESLQSALLLHRIIQEVLECNEIPTDSVSMIPTNDRAMVGAMLEADDYIDVMIPRGGKGLIERVTNEARMPVFNHLDGICHTYIHHQANSQMAQDIVINSKLRRTGICGAMETLLLDKALPLETSKKIVIALLDAGCELVGDQALQALDSRIGAATKIDWETEYLDSKLSCRQVGNIEQAIDHINQFGSHHTDCIVTDNPSAAELFFNQIDSCIVMHNTSSQFADGNEFGMGAEIGIATGKIHARGPVGLPQLCTYKYRVHGNGQIRNL